MSLVFAPVMSKRTSALRQLISASRALALCASHSPPGGRAPFAANARWIAGVPWPAVLTKALVPSPGDKLHEGSKYHKNCARNGQSMPPLLDEPAADTLVVVWKVHACPAVALLQ